MVDVSMDYDVVQSMSDDFHTSAEVLTGVSQALEIAIAFLKMSSFVGLVGDEVLTSYLEGIKPNVDRLAATCEELSLDLLGAIAYLRDGDYSGSLRFTGADQRFGTPVGGNNGGAAQQDYGPSLARDVLSAVTGGVGLILKFMEAKGNKALAKKLGTRLSIIGAFFSGYLDFTEGREDFLNAFGNSIFGAGIDFVLDDVTVGILPVVLAVSDLNGLLGKADVWIEGQLYDLGNLDPQVRSILQEGLDQADRVYEGSRLSNVYESLKDLAYDVLWRPSMNQYTNAFNQFQNGQIVEGFGSLTLGVLLGTSVTSPVGLLFDPQAMHSVITHGAELGDNAINFVTSFPQLFDESFRGSMRIGIGGFNSLINNISMDPGLRSTLNEACRQTAEVVNHVPIASFVMGGPISLLESWTAQQAQQIIPEHILSDLVSTLPI